MEDHKTAWTLLGLLVLGGAMGLGKLLVSDEVLTPRVIAGRTILGACTTIIAGVVLIQIPDVPPLALLGIGSVLGTLGAQFIELHLKRRAGNFMRGDRG